MIGFVENRVQCKLGGASEAGMTLSESGDSTYKLAEMMRKQEINYSFKSFNPNLRCYRAVTEGRDQDVMDMLTKKPITALSRGKIRFKHLAKRKRERRVSNLS